MTILLDTHAFIWFMNGDKNLSQRVRQEIEDIDNRCYLSIASLWEIAIKTTLGKLDLKRNFGEIADFLVANDIEILPITFEHVSQLTKLRYLHHDPFDRLIISQGKVEKLTIATKDKKFPKYKVETFWD
ncbi:MAG: type II toxin-antitoxin system VapC family toxin [Bacteroidota bacterium]